MILSLGPTPLGDEYLLEPKDQPLHPLDLYQCQDCGLAQLLNNASTFAHPHLYLTGSSPWAKDHFAEYAARVTKQCELQQGDLVIDIGSNDGALLANFQKLGMNVIGYEPEYDLALCSQKNGITTITSRFDKSTSGLAGGKAKLITANNMVANLDELDPFMEGIVDLLANDGTFIFETFYLAEVLKNRAMDFVYHEQPLAFSVKPVKRLMRRYGLSLYRTEYHVARGGSILFFCAVGKPEVEDDDDLLYDRKTYAAVAGSLDLEKYQTLAFLKRVKKNGKTICGYGASATATTLLYHFGLGEYLDFLVDDDTSKIGRYSPGLHLKVEPAMRSKDADYVLCLAWRFAEVFKHFYPESKLIAPLLHFRLL